MLNTTLKTTKDLISFLKEKLTPIYGDQEATNLSFFVLERFVDFTKTDYVLDKELPADFSIDKIEQVLVRMLQHKPVQQIVGEVDFYGCTIKVTPDVLIPRPETEELVDLIVKKYKGQKGLKVIDYCTGSGCIATVLAKELAAEVVAIDVSEKALVMARINSKMNGVVVTFVETDLLNEASKVKNEGVSSFSFQSAVIDVIVANPPYVLESEKAKMSKNVLENDPHLALFVDDDKALIFYEKITALAKKQLKNGGELYFEINEKFGEQVKQLLLDNDFSEVIIVKDMQGKDRMVVGSKN